MPDIAQQAARFFSPLVIARQKIEPLVPLLVPRLLGHGKLEYPDGEPATRPAPSTADRIAIIPVFGTLVARGRGMIAWSGQTSYEALGEEIEAARADSRVAGILLDIDSPGGEATGIQELGDQIAKVNRQKPVWALAQHWAMSGAYWIASQCGRIVATPSAEVGSIGVYMVHVDASKYDEKQGFDWTFVIAGEHKVDGNMHEPLPDRVRSEMQEDVDETYAQFLAAVAKGRAAAGSSFDEKRARATKARVEKARDALKLGMVDMVATRSEALQAFAEHLSKPTTQRSKESTMTDPVQPGLAPTGGASTTAAAPAAAPAASATPAAPPAGNVVDLNAARSAGAQEMAAAAAEIVNICGRAQKMGLDGAAAMAQDFIKAGTAPGEVSKVLMNKLADQADATAISTTPAAGTAGGKRPAAAIDTQAIYASRAKAMRPAS